MLAAAAAAHVLLVLGEITLPHATAHARLAAATSDPGPVRALVLARAGRRSRSRSSAPWIGAVAVPFALVGLLAHEHAYVQAGQSVPLA